MMFVQPGKTLSVRKWQAVFVQEGSLHIGKTLRRIRRGGIHPSIRGEVWEFLLGCYDPMSTFEEREQIRQRRRLQYASWKEECKQMFPVIGSGRFTTAPVITENGQPNYDPLVLQEINLGTNSNGSVFFKELTSRGPLDKKIIQWLLTLHQIGLDVNRTDRALVFYEKKENLSKLWDILSVYAWIDNDVGYCQGMSDLCSPMIILLEDEADAFWCFERLMRRLRGNFRSTGRSVGVEAQLTHLSSITQVVDPKLHQHLDKLGGGDYLFAIRMLMVQFRREFSFCDSLYLWEVMILIFCLTLSYMYLISCQTLFLQMMWALEYDPDLFYVYEAHQCGNEKTEGLKGKPKSIKQCGKYERQNMRNGGKSAEGPLPISVFLVASVLKDKSYKLMTEARGLDDVVKILNDTTGNLDAKKTCSGAIKIHKRYLRKVISMFL
jgi:hypothetical protein